jgi:hypothetical protein
VTVYATRQEEVRSGGRRSRILVAAFPLAAGGEALIQLRDEPGLPRGGVYLLAPGETAARAPRFDELFLDLRAKAARRELRAPLARLLERARDVARAARGRPSPSAFARIAALGRAGARIDRRLTKPAPGLPVEVVLVALLLVFVSEEERYPRPRHSGADMALGRAMEALGAKKKRTR